MTHLLYGCTMGESENVEAATLSHINNECVLQRSLLFSTAHATTVSLSGDAFEVRIKKEM